jgi:hypothetical protein
MARLLRHHSNWRTAVTPPLVFSDCELRLSDRPKPRSVFGVCSQNDMDRIVRGFEIVFFGLQSSICPLADRNLAQAWLPGCEGKRQIMPTDATIFAPQFAQRAG